MTMKAIWNGTVVAQSDETVVVEGNHYFPREALAQEFFTPSRTRSVCPWKGTATYYTLTVDGSVKADAAWEYPEPSSMASQIKGRVAFWRGVDVVADEPASPRGADA